MNTIISRPILSKLGIYKISFTVVKKIITRIIRHTSEVYNRHMPAILFKKS